MSEHIATIVTSSPATSFQDRGRFGYRKLGIAPAGAIDPDAAEQANRLLGNLPQDTVIEIGPGGMELVINHTTWLSLAGCGSCKNLPCGTAREIPAGEHLKIQSSPNGLWSYLAAPGGWNVASSFGSCSFHGHSSLGPSLSPGDPLHCHGTLSLPSVKARRLPHAEERDFANPPSLRLHPGPHYADFSPSDIQQLVTQQWQISPQSDRSGYRLLGSPLHGSGSIPSLPVLIGSLQVPPSGEPIVTLNDGPTVGGYPVIALIESLDLPWLVQSPPHSFISFTWEPVEFFRTE